MDDAADFGSVIWGFESSQAGQKLSLTTLLKFNKRIKVVMSSSLQSDEREADRVCR